MLTRSSLVACVFVLGFGQTLSAQPALTPAVEAAARDAGRYAACKLARDIDCEVSLTHPDWRLVFGGGLYPPHVEDYLTDQYRAYERSGVQTTALELSQPWDPFIVDDRLYTFVPYFRSFHWEGRRREITAFFIGISEDDGESWRFLALSDRSAVGRIIPGYGISRPMPTTHEEFINWPKPSRSRFLKTEDFGFRIAPGAAAYFIICDIRKRLDSETSLVLELDNPSNPAQPIVVQYTLPTDQETLELQSPALSGFERGKHYDAVIYAIDSVTGEELFEHHQTYLFDPTYEMWQLMTAAR